MKENNKDYTRSESYQSVLSEEIERLNLIKRYLDCKKSYQACETLRDLGNDYYAGAFTGHLTQFGQKQKT